VTGEGFSFVVSECVEVLELAIKLRAMLFMTYGGSFEAFNDMSDRLKDDYLWQCATLANQICAVVEHQVNYRVADLAIKKSLATQVL
jgi:hypothetical protein